MAAASMSDLPAARNNWALCRYLDGAHVQALEILAPILKSAEPAPFARALASMAKVALGDREGATRDLQAAIRDLDAGLADAQWRPAEVDPAWVEYTYVYIRWARRLADLGRKEEAEAAYRTVIDRDGMGDRHALVEARRKLAELQ